MLDRFERIVAANAGRTAVRSSERNWTYAELDGLSRVTASNLSHLAGNEPIGIHARQDGPGLATLLAALRSGTVCAPLDWDAHPHELRERLLALGARVLLTEDPQLGVGLAEAGWHGEVIALAELQQGSAEPIDRSAKAGATALIYFSSGSTGRPKGIELPERTIAAGAASYAAALDLAPADRVAWLAPLAFGASMTTAFGALRAGATLFPFDVERGLRELTAWLRGESITVYHSIPSLFRRLCRSLQSEAGLPDLRLIKLGGEPVLADDLAMLRRKFSPDCVLVNGLGITEHAGNVCFFRSDRGEIPEHGRLPIGNATDGVELLILDRKDDVLPPGEVGQIAVVSESLAKGYWRDPRLTARRFAPLAARPGARVFRTGDMGRLDAAGRLIHLGRSDRVVQIRGKGVALDDVEAALLRQPGVTEAAVFTEQRAGDLEIVAFLVARSLEAGEIRASLARLLPEHAIPGRLVRVSSLPRLAGGKLDRIALRNKLATAGTSTKRDLDFLEFHLMGLWERALGIQNLDPEEDFFEIGGSSLAAAEIFAGIDRDLGVSLPLSSLGEHGSIRRIAALIRDHGTIPGAAPILMQPHGDGRPVFCVPGKGVDVFALTQLARRMTNQPFYGLQHRGIFTGPLAHWSLEEMAGYFVRQVVEIQSSGPYRLLGLSFGGRVCFEMARQLRAAGEEVELLAFLDTYAAGYLRPRRGLTPSQRLEAWRVILGGRTKSGVVSEALDLAKIGLRGKLALLRLALHPPAAPSRKQRHTTVRAISERASRLARHEPADVRIDLFRCRIQPPEELFEQQRTLGWDGIAMRGIVVHDIPGKHGAYNREPVVSEVADRLQALLAENTGGTRHLAERVRQRWDTLAGFWDASVGDDGSALAAEVLGPALERLLRLSPGARVLDVGCGNGWFSRKLARAGAEVVAIDVSSEMISLARARGESHLQLEFLAMDATCEEELLTLGERRFDLVTATMSLMDIVDIDPLLRALSTLVVPGGRFIFSVLDARSIGLDDDDPPSRLSIFALPGQPVSHEVVLRPLRELRRAFSAAGWELEETEDLYLPDPTQAASFILDPEAPAFLVGQARLRSVASGAQRPQPAA